MSLSSVAFALNDATLNVNMSLLTGALPVFQFPPVPNFPSPAVPVHVNVAADAGRTTAN